MFQAMEATSLCPCIASRDRRKSIVGSLLANLRMDIKRYPLYSFTIREDQGDYNYPLAQALYIMIMR